MAKIYGIIYKAMNKVNSKSYIGQTTQSLNKRIAKHRNDALNYRYNSYFHTVVRKCGKETFEWEIIARCNSLEKLNKAEIEMIKKYDTYDNGYNLTKGGEGRVGCEHTEESKKKMSEQNKGEKNGMYGRHHTEETKEKMSRSQEGEKGHNYGKHPTEETRRKQSVSKKGKNNPNYNKKFSIETRQRMSKAAEGKYVGSKNLQAKKYIITTPEGEEVFVHGIVEFCKNYKKERLDYTCLVRVARGELKQHKEYKCKYWKGETNE